MWLGKGVCDGYHSVLAGLLLMAANVLVLPPSEFSGEGESWVAGRVVLKRKITVRQDKGDGSSQKGSGKTGGKGKKGKSDKGPVEKCELHLLGGENMSEVLFIESWGETADSLMKLAQESVDTNALLRVRKAKRVEAMPKYSTSRREYYLVAEGPIGKKTLVELWTPEPGSSWSQIPSTHPNQDLAGLSKVSDGLNVCLAALITKQPGAVDRDTKYGHMKVCNAELRAQGTTVQCAFWRQHAESLASFGYGEVVQMNMVRVQFKGTHGWEVTALEATEICKALPEIEQALKDSTDLSMRPTKSLTQEITPSSGISWGPRASLNVIWLPTKSSRSIIPVFYYRPCVAKVDGSIRNASANFSHNTLVPTQRWFVVLASHYVGHERGGVISGDRGKDGLGQRASAPNLAWPSERVYRATPVT